MTFLPGARSNATRDVLSTSRMLVVSFVYALVLYRFLLSFIAPWRGGTTGWIPAAIVVLGVLAHVLLGPVAIRRMVRADDDDTLLASFRTGMFLGIGISESVALFAFVGAILTKSQWVYPLGLAFALAGMWRIAPSQRVFAHCDDLLRTQGKAIRMTDAWRRAVTGEAG